jgi:UDP-N-acetylmuramoyl-L-alanyl-D-glutamate--2,6-diaminopimelate ligase
MKLKKILNNISGYQIKGPKDIAITGVSANSKLIGPGNLFIAKNGKTYEAAQFISKAIEAGASAVVTDLYNPFIKQTVQIIHPHVSSIEAQLVDNFYRSPSRELFTIGITGTNGKTTTSYLIKNLLDSFLGPCGLIGTIEYIVGAYHYKATHTTPDVATNQKLLREMVDRGCHSAVMEVTSHALDQRRVDKIEFDVAIFTNLTQDHLDYHQTMEKYCTAKNRLFSGLGKDNPKWAVVNQDSPWMPSIIQSYSGNILTYGIESSADLCASQIRYSSEGTSAVLSYKGENVEFFWPLIGRFNVYNCLAAIAVALIRQISLNDIAMLMAKSSPIKGRLESINNAKNLKIYIDFAHTDDALLNVLAALKEIKTNGRLIVVFGCGGDRDQAKRPKMAKACEKYADLCIVTSDNPRFENPNEICQQIVAGFTKPGIYQIELDRYLAIKKAIELAKPDDQILIAGKGHENYQILAHKMLDFNDSLVVSKICEQLES